MQNKKIVQVRCHVAVQIGTTVKETVSCKVNKVKMTMTQVGVHMSGFGVDILVPFTNIQRIDLDDDAEVAEETGTADTEKRKPGRPAKSPAH